MADERRPLLNEKEKGDEGDEKGGARMSGTSG